MEATGHLQIRWIQGFTSNTIEFVDNKTVCFPCGNHICFLNLETKKRSLFPNPHGDLGAFTANGNGGIFAFSEQRLSPSIFVYNYPNFMLKNELKGTAQLEYTCLAFSNGGPFLVCCASLPDYTISVWNWEKAELVCAQPQAGKDVISLVSNPLNCLQFCAFGKACVTVWTFENSGFSQVLNPRVIELPVTDRCFDDGLASASWELPSSLLKKPISPRVTPSAMCWTATSDLYVACKEGLLLLVDTESLSVSVLFNPTLDDAIPELKKSYFQALTLHEKDVIAVGKESVVHCLQIRGTQINVIQSWQLERPATNAILSPDRETLLLPSSTGQIYALNPTRSDNIVTVVDVSSGNFLTAAFLPSDRNICVSLRESGELQVWSPDGICLKSLSLHTEMTSLACCPIALYAAGGTASGNVLIIDLNNEEQPRLVHQIQLYHTAVDQLVQVFDQSGHYLLTSGSDSHIYVLHAKPSMGFSVMGYTVIPGHVLSLCTQHFTDDEEVRILALCNEQGDKNEDGDLIVLFSLPVRKLPGPDCVDHHGCLSAHLLKMFRYKVPHPLTSCVLGSGEVFAYSHTSNKVQRFQLPEVCQQDTERLSSELLVELRPEQEVKGHLLGPVSLFLSPNCLWLASGGRDGRLCIRQTAAMDQGVELKCHSCHLGGVRTVSFSADGHAILTTGFGDGSLLCTNYSNKDVAETRNAASLCLENIFTTENPILTDLPAWKQELADESEKSDEASGGISIDITGQDESYNKLLGAPPAHPTWLESRHEAVVQEDNEKYSEIKKNIKEEIQELRDTIEKMIRENEHLPLEQFNLNVEEQKRLEASVEEEVVKVRAEIELDIAEKRRLYESLKKECWDSFIFQSRAIKAFHFDLEVENFPLKERTEKECEDLRRVENIRKMEMAVSTLSSVKKKEQSEEHHEAQSASLTGSFSAQLGYSNPYLYDQFSLQTIEKRINQIILLQDVIYRIKTGFDNKFEALYSRKVRELKYVKDRNKLIKEMMLELDIHQDLWEPSLTDSEFPERLFSLDNSEFQAENRPVAARKDEEWRKLEEEGHLATQDDSRDKALYEMMENELEPKKMDLKMEISPPGFMLTKPDTHWSMEEKNVSEEYKKKTKALNEEKEKYKKSLEVKINQLQKLTKDATEKFDETLTLLLEKKMKCTFSIYQEELKIARLVDSLVLDEEMRNEELELSKKLQMMKIHKSQSEEELIKYNNQVKSLRKEYDIMVAQHKDCEKSFRKRFSDVPSQLVDLLYKMFKNRPRVQTIRSQTSNASILCSGLLDTSSLMLKGMDELDDPCNMPKGLSSSIWQKFCLFRRSNVQNEQEQQVKASVLAQAQDFLQRKIDEDKAAHQEVKNLDKALESLEKKRNDNVINPPVQIILKQGQVEVSTIDLMADTAETNIILHHKSIADNLRGTIRNLAEENVAIMEKCKAINKEVIQLQWKHKVMNKKIEDLNDKMKDIKMFRLTREQRDFISQDVMDPRKWTSKKVTDLEMALAAKKKAHKSSTQQRKKKIAKYNNEAAVKAKQNIVLEQEIADLHVTVSELTHICETADAADKEATNRDYQVQRRQLEDRARAQSEELDVLQREVERLRRRNFPSLDQLKYR